MTTDNKDIKQFIESISVEDFAKEKIQLYQQKIKELQQFLNGHNGNSVAIYEDVHRSIPPLGNEKPMAINQGTIKPIVLELLKANQETKYLNSEVVDYILKAKNIQEERRVEVRKNVASALQTLTTNGTINQFDTDRGRGGAKEYQYIDNTFKL